MVGDAVWALTATVAAVRSIVRVEAESASAGPRLPAISATEVAFTVSIASPSEHELILKSNTVVGLVPSGVTTIAQSVTPPTIAKALALGVCTGSLKVTW